jgi:predicted branched-subunit amino acid permease
VIFSRKLRRQSAFMEGVRDMLPQAPGIAAWGLMTGVSIIKSGMSLTESLAMTLLVFAGSSQLASLPLIIAGAPAWVILATGFCVNLRFVVFSLHLRPHLMHLPLWQRLSHGYFTADITYVLFTQRYHHAGHTADERRAQEAYLAGNGLVNWCSWVGSGLIGVALANFIPTAWGLGFAGILCLVGILCSLASTRLRLLAAAVAGAVGVVAYALPLKLNIVAAIGVAVLIALSAEKLRAPGGNPA